MLVGNGNSLPILYSGSSFLPMSKSTLSLNHLLHVPSISHNLLSVHKLATDNHCRLIFDEFGFVIQDRITYQILHQGPSSQGLYPIQACINNP